MNIEELKLLLNVVVVAVPIITSQFFISKKSQKDIEIKILRVELYQSIDNDYGMDSATEIYLEYKSKGGNGRAHRKYLDYIKHKEMELIHEDHSRDE